MPEAIPRVVFDCNVIVQGIANRNSFARKSLRAFFNDTILLFVSEPILREVHDVLSRPEIRSRLPGINDRIVNAFLAKLQTKAVLITNVPEEYHYERDPDDEKYLNIAIVTNASYLVSQDQDLLNLATTSTEIARQFRSRYPLLRIVSPIDFVKEIESLTAAPS